MIKPTKILRLAANLAIAGLALPPVLAQTSPSTTAADNYKTNCALCHGPDGSGSELGKRFGAPDLRSKEIQDKPATELAHSITAGKNKMPAFGAKFDEQQIQKLVEYVRTFRADAPPAAK